MTIFAKKRFAFGPGATKGSSKIELIYTNPNVFQDVPDFVLDDPLFQAALRTEDVKIIVSKQDEKVIETILEAPTNAEVVHNDKTEQKNELDEFKATINGMNKEALVAKAEELKISLTGDESNKRLKILIFNASIN